MVTMLIAENVVYLWLIPVALQIVTPLVVLSCWTMTRVFRKTGAAFSKQKPLIPQPT